MTQNDNANQRLSVLLASVGVGVLLIASGVAMRGQQGAEVEIAIASTYTALAPTETSTPTDTPTSTNTPTDTPTITLTPSNTPTGTLPPTATPTDTPTPSPTPVPGDAVTLDEDYGDPDSEPATAIPTPVPPVPVPNGVTNILLMGSDKREDDGGYRTDSLIVVSINQNEGTVNMLSLPRDLFIYIPGYTMARINRADQRGQSVGWDGGGPGLIKEALLYNFGITIHHYARVDFGGFQDIVDILDGVEVPVDCAITAPRLVDTSVRRDDFDTYQEWVDYTVDEDNWIEEYTLPVGVHDLNGYMALWYARARKGSSDFDRARRQQQVLRAILAKARSDGLLNVLRVGELWQEYSDIVETDMGLGNMLQLVPIAADLDPNEINSYIITPDLLTSFRPAVGPDVGGSVLLPNPGAVESLVALAMQPPAQNYIIQNSATVEVRNGTSLDRLDEVAADRLGWNGLQAIPTGFAPDAPGYEETVIFDFTGGQKSSQLILMQRILHVADVDVISQPDPNRTVDYVVVIGENYRSCRNG